MKKLSILLSALLLSATPVLADDYLYLKCEESIEANLRHAQTSEFIKKEAMPNIVLIYKIAIKDQILKGIVLNERGSLKTYDVQIDDDRLTYSEDLGVGTGKSSFQLIMNLSPPFDLESKGRFISNEQPVIITWKNQGVCKNVAASVFEKAINQ